MTHDIEHTLKRTANGYLEAQNQILRAIDAEDQSNMDAAPPAT